MTGNTLAVCVYLPLKHILVVSLQLGLGCFYVNFWAIQLIMECLQLYGLLLCFWYFCCSSRVLKPHSVLFQYLLPEMVLDQLISLKYIPTIQPKKTKKQTKTKTIPPFFFNLSTNMFHIKLIKLLFNDGTYYLKTHVCKKWHFGKKYTYQSLDSSMKPYCPSRSFKSSNISNCFSCQTF